MERAAQVANESQIAILFLLSANNDDLESVLLCPSALADDMPSTEERTRRQLRPVCVVGLSGVKPLMAIKEPLSPHVVDGISAAFLEYVRVLLGDTIMKQVEAAEIAELERIYNSSGTPGCLTPNV
jgi:hypothetical protein